jgi:alpha-tubulin suppressor-like RCC1 family protein
MVQVRRLAAGRDHVLAVTVEGVLYTWGRGNHGRYD